MKIKQGMYVGMGVTQVGLLVRVGRVEGSTFTGHVVNGNWDFVYDTQTKTMMFDPPMGARQVHFSNILFRDPTPKSIRQDDYNEVIYYMNKHLNRPRIVSWVLQATHSVYLSVERFYKRLKTSSQMFIRTWKQGSTDIRYIDLDDDIPF